MGNKEKYNEYRKELDIMNEMIKKQKVYQVIEEKTFAAAAKGNKREKTGLNEERVITLIEQRWVVEPGSKQVPNWKELWPCNPHFRFRKEK